MKPKEMGMLTMAALVALLLVIPTFFFVSAAVAATTVEISNASANVGGTTTAEIVAHEVTDLGGFAITLSYDPTVVNVTGVTNNPALPDNFGISDFSNASDGSVVLASSGMTRPSLSGDVLLTTVTLEAVGSAGQTSPLDIISIGLVDSGGNDISAGVTAVNGTFSITETTPPAIDFIAPTPENGSTVTVSDVNVTVSVADSSGVSTVLLNWNGDNETMNMTVDNTWSVNKNDLPNGDYTYRVYANDTCDNWGASDIMVVTVDVLTGLPKTGNINGDDAVNMEDAVYLVKYLYHVPGFDELYADGDINSDDTVNMEDAVYLVKYMYHVPGFEELYP